MQCLALWLALGCHPGAPRAPDTDAEEAGEGESTPLEPETPTNRAQGDELRVIVPLVDGGALDLASLRGRVVVLELSASTEPGWAASLAEHEALADEYGDRLRVVVVASDPDASALEHAALGPVELGWDPQGALAASLRVAAFPTVLVLDPEGKITWIERGYDEQVRQGLRAELQRLLGR